jgi:hypothetical protein
VADAATPEMEAEGTFLSGKVQVETLLNRGGFAGRGRPAGEAGASPAGVAAGGGGRRGGRGGGYGGGGGRGRGSSGAPAEDTSSGGGDAALHLHASTLPAIRVHLRLTNLGADPIEVEVTDFDSELGNFVVQPDKILLPPHESVEAEPMTSRLGVASDAIPLTVTLRAAGQTDKQILTLRPVQTPAAPPAPVAPAQP